MSEIIEKTFQVPSPARLDLSNIRGSVEVHTGEEDVIRVSATKNTSSGDGGRTEIELSQGPDGTVKVATHFPDGAWSWLLGSFPCKVDYEVQAPQKCSVKINGVSNSTLVDGFEGDFSFKSVSGEMTLHALTGPVKVKTVSGDVEMTDLTGDLNLNTVSGRVTARHIQGPVHLVTVSGKVTLDESNLTSIEASTVSGGMNYQTPFAEGPYHFNSVSGDVDLLVPPETRCSAELHAISGRFFTKLPTTSIGRQDGNQIVEVQGGGVKISLRSVSGNLSLAC